MQKEEINYEICNYFSQINRQFIVYCSGNFLVKLVLYILVGIEHQKLQKDDVVFSN